MDPGLAWELLEPQPAEIASEHCQFAGAITPIVLPLGWSDPQQRADWSIERADAPMELRVRSALETGRTAEAWRLLREADDGVLSQIRLQAVLQRWILQERERLGLRSDGEQVLLLGVEPQQRGRRFRAEARAALKDCRDMLDSLPWPRWSGPLLILAGDAELPDMPMQGDLLARPALPIARLPAPEDLRDWRQDVAELCCRLHFALSDPPEAGWPRWLMQGMREVARAKARGEGPSPRRMLKRRRQAGADALRALLLDRREDPELAEALCAMLCHSRRRYRLPSLLDLLRNEVDSLSALGISYELEVLDLLKRR